MTPVVGSFPSFSIIEARQNEKKNELFRGALLVQLPEF
jgi:hypothetical protein